MPPSAPTPRFTWRTRHAPIATPNVPFTPPLEEAREIYLEVADRWLSPPMVAARHGTTLSAFLTWLADPANFTSVPEPTFNLPPTVEDLHYDHEASDAIIARYRAGEPIADIAKAYSIPAEDLAAYLAHPRAQIQMNAMRELEDAQDIDVFKANRRFSSRRLVKIIEDATDDEIARKASTALFRLSNYALNPPSPRSPGRGPEAWRGGEGSSPSMSPDRQGGGTAPHQPPRPPDPSRSTSPDREGGGTAPDQPLRMPAPPHDLPPSRPSSSVTHHQAAAGRAPQSPEPTCLPSSPYPTTPQVVPPTISHPTSSAPSKSQDSNLRPPPIPSPASHFATSPAPQSRADTS